MKHIKVRLLVLVMGLALLGSTAVFAGSPTCSELGFATHAQHIIGDYVTGTGVSWPPAGAVGEVVGGQGAAVPGGPGPGFHFSIEFAPGASFCNPQSQSPGFHLPSD